MRFDLAPLAIVLAACASAPSPPRCAVENDWGVVHAATPEAAARLSGHVLWLAPRIEAVVPGLSNRPLDARFVRGVQLEGISSEIAPWVKGATISTGPARWIELPEGTDVVAERQALAHELVHFWLGSDWETLPYFLEEGLAENVRDSLVPAGYAKASLERALILASVRFGGLILDANRRAIRCGSLGDLADPTQSLQVALFSKDRRALPTVREMLALHRDALRTVRDPEDYAVMFGYGYLLVARIGVERLHALCLRAHAGGHRLVPADWVLEAAGLAADDLEAWNRAIVELQRGAN